MKVRRNMANDTTRRDRPAWRANLNDPSQTIVIVGAARTAIGKYGGAYRRESPRRLPVRAPGKHPGERRLRQVLRAMRVARHPRAQALDRPFPTRDQPGERLRVIFHLDPPHRLLIARRH